MSGFYARYVPPSTSQATSSTNTSAATSIKPEQKRKRPVEEKPKEKSRKRRRGSDDAKSQADAQTDDTTTTANSHEAEETNAASVLSKYSITAAAAKNNADVKFRKVAASSTDGTETKTEEESGKMRKKYKTSKKVATNNIETDSGPDEEYQRKHFTVLSKLDKARTQQKTAEATEIGTIDDSPAVELHGLEPIPQPEEKPEVVSKPAYSTLPSWQSSAVKVVHGARKLFSEFSLSETTLHNLQKNNLRESFAVQTTVIPLLLEGDQHHNGDVCVSAATGSGKTLAYVLPMIESLRRFPTTRLRGVVVVPTRELVKQVRQTCEICAAGSNIKIATAVGNKSLKEEQATLVERDVIYDPEEYQRQQEAPIDWTNFSIEKLMRSMQPRGLFQASGFVERWKSKVDILVTTPGRLVEHLKSTEGFNLDYVQWMVVDEADRLLNESYQEWIETVMPALRSQASTRRRDEQLRYMRLDVPKRVVRKVLLSATMTRDISKLNSLELANPKLVILGSHDSGQEDSSHLQEVEKLDEPQPGEDGAFQLPESLTEYTVIVKDGAEKPLQLLHLLRTKMLPSSQQSNGALGEDDTSSSGSDSSDSSSDSSSESETSSSDGETPTTVNPRKTNSFLGQATSNTPRNSSHNTTTRALIFTRSTASASRLSRLLSLLSPSLSISTLTRSTASSSTSRQSLKAFISGRTSLLIATDRASRGLDIPDLEHVISYDVPSSALTYVHRVGRTARAGKAGTAWTMVEWREGRWFGEEIGGKAGKEGKVVRKGKMKKWEVRLPEGKEGEELRERYESALKQLGEEVRGKR